MVSAPAFGVGNLAELRNRSDQNAPELLTAARGGVFAPDGTGGGSYAPATTHVFSVRAGPLGDTPEEQRIADAVSAEHKLRVSLPLGSDLLLSDTVQFRAREWDVVAQIEEPSYAVRSAWVIARG